MEKEISERYLILAPAEGSSNVFHSENEISFSDESGVCLASVGNSPNLRSMSRNSGFGDEDFETPQIRKRVAQNKGFSSSSRKRHRSRVVIEPSKGSMPISLFTNSEKTVTVSVGTSTMPFRDRDAIRSLLKRKHHSERSNNPARRRRFSTGSSYDSTVEKHIGKDIGLYEGLALAKQYELIVYKYSF